MRAGPGPGGRPQRDVRKPLARHASHGGEEAVEPQAGLLSEPGVLGQPATFAPQPHPPLQGYEPRRPEGFAPQGYEQPYEPQQYEPQQYEPPDARPAAPGPQPQAYEPYPAQAPDPYAAARPEDLPPVVPVAPGPLTSALPTALNYGAPAAPAPAVPVVPVVPVPPVHAPRPETSVPAAGPFVPPTVEPAAPSAVPSARTYEPVREPAREPFERHDPYQPYEPRTYEPYESYEPYEPAVEDGHRIRSAADTGSLLVPARRSRRGGEGSHRTGPPAKGSAPVSALGAAVEVVVVVVLALVLAVVVKTFLVQAFYIPSESMEDTLLIGDRVLVSKLTPGPFDLHRGDVVVFEDSGKWLTPAPPAQEGGLRHALRSGLTFIGLLPADSSEHLIKRVVGLPGDTVKCCDVKGRLMVNGIAVDEPYLQPGVAPSEQKFSVTVPAGRLWVMGDNRPFSADSRSHTNLPGGGTVPVSDVVGKAFVIVWPFSRAGGLGIPDTVFARVPSSSGGS